MPTLTDSIVPPQEISPGCFPYGFRRELKAVFKLAWPTSLSIMFHQLLQPISLAFCGHLGETELAAVAISLSFIYMTTVSMSRGLAFGGDTFFAQTYGSRNKKKMGVYLQKAIIFGIFVSLTSISLLLNTQNILLLARQPPDVARLAQKYCMLFCPGALAYCWLFTLMRYLMCQNRVIPNLIVCVISCLICCVLNYGLLFQAKMGIAGSAIALSMTYYLVVFQLVGYMWASGIYKETWGGWTWECLLDWTPFAKVVLSSVFMTFIFWFYTEVGTFVAGLLSARDIAAFSIQWQVEGFMWMIPLGLGGACTARIGQYLGANLPTGALTSARVTLFVQLFIAIAMAGAVYLLRHYIPMIFTSQSDLAAYTTVAMPIVAIFILLEGVGGVAVGIVRGTGRQTLGAVIVFVGGYLFSLPIGIPLAFLTSIGISGLWWGNVVGLFVEGIFLLIFVAKLNWAKEAEKAQERAGVESEETLNQSNSVEAAPPNADDEHTPLLQAASINRSGTLSGRYEDVRWSVVITSRVFILLLFMGLTVGAYLVQQYVHVPVSWSQLCSPANLTDVADSSQVTLPPCENVTSSGSFLPSHAEFYRPWIPANIRL